MATAKEWTPETAMDELFVLIDRYKDKPLGERLTLEVARRLIGVSTIATVSRWRARSHAPKGATFLNLATFLNKAQDHEWLKKKIAAEYKKHITTKGK